MLDALLDQLSETLLLGAVTAGDEGGACGYSQGNGINGRFDIAEGHAFRLHADAAGWRRLARGQAVDLVVHDDIEKVHIAAHGVDEMVAADSETVAVAAGHKHGEFMIGELQTSSHGEGTAVQGVHAVGIHVAGEVGGTSDAADGDDVVVRDAQFDEGFLYGRKHAEIAATGTPVGINSAFHVGHGQLLTGTLYACRHCVSSSDHNLVHGNGEFRLPGELLLHGFDNVVRHEGFAVVLANVAVRHKAGFAAQVARKLAAVIVLHDDGVPRVFQNFENGIAMQRHKPANLKLIGRDSLFIENLTGFLDHAFRGTPADQSNIGVARTRQRWRRHCGFNPCHLAHALFHHGATPMLL